MSFAITNDYVMLMNHLYSSAHNSSNQSFLDHKLDQGIKTITPYIDRYVESLTKAMHTEVMGEIYVLSEALLESWKNSKTIYLCGNGGSAGNAIHLANDFIYGAGKKIKSGLKVEALSANSAVLTCLANDLGYDEIYAQQLRVKAQPEDVLIVLSGSGNSPNVVKALEVGNSLGMQTFAILGYSGGMCKKLAKTALHFPIHDMQIAEDLQLIVGHICMQWLCDQLKDESLCK